MKKIFLSDDRDLHRAIEAAFSKELEVIRDFNKLDQKLVKMKSGLLILDAEYGDRSGYAICEDVKSRFGDHWRVHILSNEMSIGEREKADYALVDRLFLVPHEMESLTHYD